MQKGTPVPISSVRSHTVDLGEMSIKLSSLMEQKAGYLGLDIGNSQNNQAMGILASVFLCSCLVAILKQVSSQQKEKIAPCHIEHVCFRTLMLFIDD
jgi:hypothetical protein